VRVKTSSGPLQVQTALGSILAELFAGARLEDSSLVAGAGDITVLIPSNVALSVLARNDSGAESSNRLRFFGSSEREVSLPHGRACGSDGVSGIDQWRRSAAHAQYSGRDHLREEVKMKKSAPGILNGRN